MKIIALLLSLIAFTSLHAAHKDCRDLLKKIKQKGQERTPISRFYNHLSEINSHLNQGVADNMTRHFLFRVQGMLKVYKKFDKPITEELYEQAKAFEDHIGRLDAYVSYLEFAKNINADPKVLAEIQREVDLKEAELKTFVNSFSLENFIKNLQQVDWKDYNKDRKYVLKKFKKMAKEVAEFPYDMNLLQEGVHEYRRDLRWFLIVIHSFEGLIQFLDGAGNSTVKEFNDLLISMKDNKYLKYDISADEIDPILLSKPYYYRLSQMVAQLGDLKDQGENIHFTAEAYVKAGLYDDIHHAEEKILELAKESGIELINSEIVLREANKLYDEIQANGGEKDPVALILKDLLEN